MLSTLPDANKDAFYALLRKLLPGVTYERLYRGSVNGLNPAAFHRGCDRKGATLTVIRCTRGNVFGGYTSCGWRASESPTYVRSDDAFVFTVLNPHGIPPTAYPLKDSEVSGAIWCSSRHGPCFGDDILLSNGRNKNTAKQFNGDSSSNFPVRYVDTTGKGKNTFTGSYNFVPAEVEVWRVL